jgi:predicted branched-subunit amino acid permease
MSNENNKSRMHVYKFFLYAKWLFTLILVAIIIAYALGVDGINPIGLVAYVPMLLIFHFVGNGAKNNKHWALIASFIISLLLLIAFPVGTILGSILFIICLSWKEELDNSKQPI